MGAVLRFNLFRIPITVKGSFLIIAVLLGFSGIRDPAFIVAWVVISRLIFVNVFWGLLNWLPVRPLDGGHLLEALLEKIAPDRAETIARVVFTFTAGAALIAAIRFRLIFIAVLAGWLLLSEFNFGRTPQPQAPLPPLTYDQPEADIIDVDPEPDQ